MSPRALLALLLIAGCDRVPDQLTDCPDADCQRRWLDQAIHKDPDAAVQALRALPPGIDRETLIQVMMVERPEHTAPLCLELPPPSQAHAWAPDQGRRGAGQAYPVLSVELGELQHPWNQLDPLAVECTDEWTDNTCIGQQAVEWARKHKHQDAWRICLGAEQEKWRYECFFQISEETYDPRKGGIPELAAEMCLFSGFYQDRCLGHMAGRLGRNAPAATWDDPERWHTIDHAVQQIQHALYKHSPALASRWTALTWAYAMDAAYAEVEHPVGNPIDHVHPAAMPHIAASVAWSLWLSEGHRAQSIDAWVDQFDQAMRRREVDPAPQPKLDEVNELSKSWNDSLPGEEAIDWTVYRGPIARRAVGHDPRGDAVICLLEAAARNPTPHRASLFKEALGYPDVVVRWTAARLVAQRMPVLLEQLDPSEEDDPLVRARLEGQSGGSE